MSQFKGIPASPGIALGPVFHYQPLSLAVEKVTIKNPEAEWSRLERALDLAENQLQGVYQKSLLETSAASAEIFQAQLEMLRDPELLSLCRHELDERLINIEVAWQEATEHYARMLEGMQSEYFRARAADVRDMSGRLLRCLQGDENLDRFMLTRPSIIVAEDLTPSDTIQFDKDKILGFCTSRGGPTSHTAIIARSLGVPALVSAAFKIEDIESGVLAILDGIEGIVIISPSTDELSAAREKRAAWETARGEQVAATHQPATTLDGHTAEVVANIGGEEDAKKAVALGAEGVGLFRTEFLYLDRSELLDLDEQVSIYRSVMRVMAGRPLVVRSLDIGGDKSVPYLSLKEEQNPFLGWRGIRMLRERPDILANQFEALLRAGVGADLRIMLPMVSGSEEVERARQILDEVQELLKTEGVPFAQRVQFGIMIEVPSAALLAEHLAPKVDFFSIGTNDLTQYTLAVDRTNERVAVLASPYNPAVLKLIWMTIQAAHQYGKWVGLCGELAGDVAAVPLLLGMGLDEFSMAPAAIPAVKQAIRRWSLSRCKEVAKAAMSMPGSTEVINYLKELQPS